MKKAIGIVEVAGVPVGLQTADAMAKAAAVELVQSLPVCPGKYLVVIAGDVGAVRESVRTAEVVSGSGLTDSLVIPNTHPSLVPALSGTVSPTHQGALGVLESLTCPSIVVAADAAAKAATVELVEVRLARGLGGKSFFAVTGDVGAVKAAVAAAEAAIRETGFLLGSVVIPSPHRSLWPFVL